MDRNYNTNLTQAFLKSVISYDEETGLFTWISSRGKAKPNKPAGYLTGRGYVIIKICGFAYQAHRLAWLYFHGSHPSEFIDHIDCNRSNNAISNLREASNAQNLQNISTPRATNKSGFLGVCKASTPGKWRAQIRFNNRPRQIGEFNTPEEAHEAYVKEKRRLHEFCTI